MQPRNLSLRERRVIRAADRMPEEALLDLSICTLELVRRRPQPEHRRSNHLALLAAWRCVDRLLGAGF